MVKSIEMEKQDIIRDIEALYPIDSGYEDTSKIGEQLLLGAIRETDWRELPIEVLIKYRQQCLFQENASEITLT